jgi:hypothetical protein
VGLFSTGGSLRSRLLGFLCVLACALGLAGPAEGSKIIAGNASQIQLAVNNRGKALITYKDGGRLTHLIAWGAIDARVRPPTEDGPKQVKFKLDYSGGWGTLHRPIWKTFNNACRPYDGPALAWFVGACKAPDGSYWALQSWQTRLPDLGFAPWLAQQGQWWLHLSHWSGPLGRLDVYRDWLSGDRFQEVFGQYRYRGVGVRGFGTSGRGAPSDGYGRLVYIDTHNSVYGAGWRRDTSIVSHGRPGIFCHGFVPTDPYSGSYAHPTGTPHRMRGPGTGDLYRITVTGPGVAPDLTWQGPGLHPYDPRNPADVRLERQMNAKLDSIRGSERNCADH